MPRKPENNARQSPGRGVSHLPPIAIVVSRYNASVTGPLRDGALAEYRRRGGTERGVVVFEAPGSFELPAVSLAAAVSDRFAGVVALGCIIKGDTSHDRVIADAVAQGITGVTLQTGVPVAFGVLTVDSPEQARDRAGGSKGNKGAEAMSAVLETIAAMRAAAGIGDGAEGWESDGDKPDKAAKPSPRRRTR